MSKKQRSIRGKFCRGCFAFPARRCIIAVLKRSARCGDASIGDPVNMGVRFLTTEEYQKTKPLAAACFGDDAEVERYYAEDVADNRIAVWEEGGAIRSMVQLRRVIAAFAAGERAVWYLLYVATAPEHRRRGYMDAVMRFTLDALRREGESFAFLTPVDPAIYAHLGFTALWEFREEERALLYADDGLTRCAACSLTGDAPELPSRLRRAESPRSWRFSELDAERGAALFDYFHIRPNRTCDSIPLETISYALREGTRVCETDGRCLLLLDSTAGHPAGCIPFCREEELPYYFKMQERYFNEVLHEPLRAYWGDEAGVTRLREAGLLEHYEVTENPEIYDYLYAGDDLRTLAGRKYAKKRNRISKFERDYAGRWEYRTLGYEQRSEIIEFLKSWNAAKTEETVVGYEDVGLDSAETLAIDVSGAERALNCRALMEKMRAGGIYVDGELCAFSMGGYNPREKMAVIDTEKAREGMEGLYQLINREFLLHEFPEAELINREDDVGLPGLRKSKLSYYPLAFARRFSLIQLDFPHKT